MRNHESMIEQIPAFACSVQKSWLTHLIDQNSIFRVLSSKNLMGYLGFRFDIAFSFAGPNRPQVEAIAEIVASRLGKERVFYDAWYQHEIFGPNMRVMLQRIYYEKSLMIVSDVSTAYSDRKWCQGEAEAIDALKMQLNTTDEIDRLRVVTLKFDSGNVPGVLPNAGYIDAHSHDAQQCAELLLKRHSLLIQRLDPPSADDKDLLPPSNSAASSGAKLPLQKSAISPASNHIAALIGLFLACSLGFGWMRYHGDFATSPRSNPNESLGPYSTTPLGEILSQRIASLEQKMKDAKDFERQVGERIITLENDLAEAKLARDVIKIRSIKQAVASLNDEMNRETEAIMNDVGEIERLPTGLSSKLSDRVSELKRTRSSLSTNQQRLADLGEQIDI